MFQSIFLSLGKAPRRSITFICTGNLKNSCDSLFCSVCCIAMGWNWTCGIFEVCLDNDFSNRAFGLSPCLELLMYLKADPLCFANVNFSKRSFQFVSFLYSEAFWSTQVKCSQPADIYWVWNTGYLCYRFKARYDTVFFSWAPNLEAKRSWGQDESPDNKAATF